MPLYVVTRTDRVGWDEYDGFVVRADDPDSAVALIRASHSSGVCGLGGPRDEDEASLRARLLVEEINPDGEPAIILESFCAG